MSPNSFFGEQLKHTLYSGLAALPSLFDRCFFKKMQDCVLLPLTGFTDLPGMCNEQLYIPLAIELRQLKLGTVGHQLSGWRGFGSGAFLASWTISLIRLHFAHLVGHGFLDRAALWLSVLL